MKNIKGICALLALLAVALVVVPSLAVSSDSEAAGGGCMGVNQQR
jgi:hypothetical protein